MPSKKRKYNARFPAGRIKKIMRIDDEIGKVALPVPVMISRALELFVSSLLIKAGDVTMQKSARTLTLAHLKQCIYSDSRLDFLKELVKSTPDHSEECNNTTDPPVAQNNPASNNDSDEETSLETIECRLLNGCACRLSADEYEQLVSVPAEVNPSPSDIIAHLSAMRLMLSSRRCRQHQPDSGCCPTVERACLATLSSTLWFDRLLSVLASADDHVRYVATCVATEVVLGGAADDGDSAHLIDELLLMITKTIQLPHSRASAAAVNVLSRVLDAKNDDWRISSVDTFSCCGGDSTVRFSTVVNGCDTKMLLLDRLHCRWSEVVNAVLRENGTMVAKYHEKNDLPELIGLWTTVFRALRSMGIECQNREQFYLKLLSLEWLLYRTDTEPLVWLNTIRLFGGSLQRCVGPPMHDQWMASRVAVARSMLTSFTHRRLLYFMGKMESAFGRENDRTNVVLQETVLLAMRSLREFAAGLSRPFSSDDDKEVALVTAIRDVINCLDSYVKSSMLYAMDIQFCQWTVRLMCDRDDATIECLSCALDVVDAVPVIQQLLDPFASFAELLACVSYEPDVLLDYLISDDSEFLPYALRVLKMACRDAQCFFRSCGSGLDDAMGLLIRLRLKMLRLHKNCVFPFNVVPFTKLIQRCDELYTEIGS